MTRTKFAIPAITDRGSTDPNTPLLVPHDGRTSDEYSHSHSQRVSGGL